MGSFLGSKNGLGTKHAPRLLQEAFPPFRTHLFGDLLGYFFCIFCIFCLKRGVLKYVSFFLRFLGRPELSTGWAHMQSVHAGAVQTHFFSFAFFLENSFLGFSLWVHFGSMFFQKLYLFVKNGFQKSLQKKGPAHDANATL